MSGPARPLRFVILALSIWIGGRVVALWPVGNGAMPTPSIRLAAAAHASTPARPAREREASRRFVAEKRAIRTVSPSAIAPPPLAMPIIGRPSAQSILLAATARGTPFLAMLALAGTRGGALVPSPSSPASAPPPKPRRWSGYGWVFARAGGGAPGLSDNGRPGSQLGGSQAGLRIDYALGPDPAYGVRLGARVSAPLSGRGREAALVLGWKPAADLPLTLSLERRIGLDAAGRNAFAAGIAGGAGPIALPARFSLEAYGQAGMVGARRHDPFADGAASAIRPVAAGRRVSLAAGAGIWGAAQPGATRLDIGPRARVRIDAGRASIGAALDWRQRVAGNAAPGSGLAITLDGSF